MLTTVFIASLALASRREQRPTALLRTRGGQVPPPPRGPRPPEPPGKPGSQPPRPPPQQQASQPQASPPTQPQQQPPPPRQQPPPQSQQHQPEQQRAQPKPQAQQEPQPQPGPGVDVGALEKRSGVRLSWHVWPQTAAEAEALAAPHGLLFSPLTPIDGLVRLDKEPVRCSHCRGVLNPFARVEPHARRWACPLCSSWNTLPDDLATATSMPTELSPAHATIEYEIPASGVGSEAEPASLLLVVDCSLPSEEFAKLEETLTQMVADLPPDTPVRKPSPLRLHLPPPSLLATSVIGTISRGACRAGRGESHVSDPPLPAPVASYCPAAGRATPVPSALPADPSLSTLPCLHLLRRSRSRSRSLLHLVAPGRHHHLRGGCRASRAKSPAGPASLAPPVEHCGGQQRRASCHPRHSFAGCRR